MYSPPLSDLSFLSFRSLDRSAFAFYPKNFSNASLFLLIGYVHTYLDLSSMNVIKYSFPLNDGLSIFPHTSVCTRSNTLFARVLSPCGNLVCCCLPSAHGSQKTVSSLFNSYAPLQQLLLYACFSESFPQLKKNEK